MVDTKDIVGFSFIWGKGIFHIGRYMRGYWFDANVKLDPDIKDDKAFGIKFDIAYGRMIRPIPCFWKKEFWDQKPTIKEVLDRGDSYAKKYFGKLLYKKILKVDPVQLPKRGAYNPWYAKYWFVLRLPKIPIPSFSIGTPWRNIHIGSKGYKVDPFTKDSTWCSRDEQSLALKEDPKDRFYALALSMTIRKSRA
jgi:hypothetical protein